MGIDPISQYSLAHYAQVASARAAAPLRRNRLDTSTARDQSEAKTRPVRVRISSVVGFFAGSLADD